MATVPISSRLDKKDLQRLDAVAAQNGVERSKQIAHIIRSHLDGTAATDRLADDLGTVTRELQDLSQLLKSLARQNESLSQLTAQKNREQSRDFSRLNGSLDGLKIGLASTLAGLLYKLIDDIEEPQQAEEWVKQRMYQKPPER